MKKGWQQVNMFEKWKRSVVFVRNELESILDTRSTFKDLQLLEDLLQMFSGFLDMLNNIHFNVQSIQQLFVIDKLKNFFSLSSLL